LPDTPPPELLAGTLHAFVAFDWGEEVDLAHARRLAPAQTPPLPRRPRTPPSIDYKPPPLRFLLEPAVLEWPELGRVAARPEATVFDFAAVSVAFRLPFQLPPAALTRLAGALADPAPVVRNARALLDPLYGQLLPAVKHPAWRDNLSEEYFVFQFPPGGPLRPDLLLGDLAGWLAGLLRREAGPLSREETAEAVRRSLRYSPDDLFAPDWAAAVLLDRDCDETLQTVEFTNLQLLEFRHIDNRLDDALARAYALNYQLTRSWLPFWNRYSRPLRALGGLKLEANELFERTANVLKLVGDQYLARVYALLAARFHLEEWERSIRRKLEVIEGVYQVLADQASADRIELLELIVVILILLEIVMPFFHR
jgi:hypothetical protein